MQYSNFLELNTSEMFDELLRIMKAKHGLATQKIFTLTGKEREDLEAAVACIKELIDAVTVLQNAWKNSQLPASEANPQLISLYLRVTSPPERKIGQIYTEPK